MTLPDLEQVEVTSQAALWAWLETHHSQDASVLLVTWKKAAGETYVGRDAVLDALIAYGWIDGRRYKHEDAMRTIQLIAPRAQTVWAETYKQRAVKLEQEGRMQDAGRTAIAFAKSAGLWNAGKDVDALLVSAVLAEALEAKHARSKFDAMAPSYRRNVLRWLNLAKQQKTQVARAEKIAEYSARGEKIPQY
ncbi:YdeI family protein [Planktotalea sp.]|uniref:YdeI/OmpD-associated family protein n=1 Tax=Planktotalea sp. TaxID=2029877 RepID=UPI0035C83FD7